MRLLEKDDSYFRVYGTKYKNIRCAHNTEKPCTEDCAWCNIDAESYINCKDTTIGQLVKDSENGKK